MITLIKNGSVWIDGKFLDANILTDENGKIAKICPTGEESSQSFQKVIDAKGCLVLPGGIDAHAHIEDGAETFFEGSCAAAAGGITTVIDMPPFHLCSTPSGLHKRMKAASQACVTDFSTHGGIVVDLTDLEQMDGVAEEGAAGFKVFMPADPPVSREVLWKAIQTAAKTGLRMVIHAEESACLESDVDWSNPLGFANARPPVAENGATAFILEMALAAGAPVHICHVSSGRTAELIDQYQGWGADVTAETTPHFLIFEINDFTKYGARIKTTPPIREKEDTEILWQALADGVIDMVVSDHFLGELPNPDEAVSFEDKGAGIAGLEVSLPLLFHTGVHGGKISIERFIEVTSKRPAEIFGLDYRKGKIAAGMDADLVIFDTESEWVVKSVGQFSRAVGLPYTGWQLKGKVTRTLVRGKEVWNGKSILAEKGSGIFIGRNQSTI
jgi:allantoinase